VMTNGLQSINASAIYSRKNNDGFDLPKNPDTWHR
jgi:hypothetical protein